MSIATQRKINERLGVEPPYRDVQRILIKKSRTLLRDVDATTLVKLIDAAYTDMKRRLEAG